MLYYERVLHAAKALAKGCFGHICNRPANSYRRIALIFPFNSEQTQPLSSRSNHRHHITRTLSNNRRTLSPKQREICLWQCFDSPSTLQNQEDCGHSADRSIPIFNQYSHNPVQMENLL